MDISRLGLFDTNKDRGRSTGAGRGIARGAWILVVVDSLCTSMYRIVGLSGIYFIKTTCYEIFFSHILSFFSHYNYNRLHALPLGCPVMVVSIV